ncbi:hypothetical protein [Nitrosomonas communis]|uniref:Uncharacterized protein n=1 Tax=Nitrosomonas communis TaxID=44574 RepID=A0A1I4TLT2_9PROT|nr:hypothetical protein [Nitrosomonas communis]SFM77571.1 hypothetical protein SAMN05421863_105212 [Nitrosomonas communis]
MSKDKILGTCLLVCVLMMTSPVQAEEDYLTGFGNKLSQGLANMAFGFIEIPKNVINIAKPARNDSKSILIVSSSRKGHTPKHCVNNKTKPLRCSSNPIYSESFLTGYAISATSKIFL